MMWKEVAKDMAAEEFDVLKHQKLPMFEMPNGKHLFVWYNRETDTLNAGPFTGTDIPDRHRFAYNHCLSMEANLQSVNEKLRVWKNTRPKCKRKATSAVCTDNGNECEVALK